LSAAQPTSDEDLMSAGRRGSRAAFEELFERYRQPAWAFFRRRVTDREAADDLTQSVFTALLQAAPRYQPRATAPALAANERVGVKAPPVGGPTSTRSQ
jgi:DNA-directed RNA polymerase specialized sigma24 family protein